MKANDHRPVLTFVSNRPGGHLEGFTQYFWLKYITGFKPENHCAACFVGKHSKKIWNGVPLNRPILLDEAKGYDFIYLCGVSEGFKWANNLHMPVRPAPGQKAIVTTYNGIRCVMKNAELLDIPRIEDGFGGYDLKHTTCRNWRFGVQYYSIKGFSSEPVQGSLL